MSRGGPTPLGVAVLALLCERAMHPYEMYQLTIERQDDRLVKVRPGSLYHAVDRLTEQRLIRAAGTDREGRRPERTTYEITADGRAALGEWVAEALGTPTEEFPAFPLAVAEAHNLPKQQVIELLRHRRTLLEQRRAEYVGGLEDAESRGVAEVFLLEVTYVIALADAELRWLELTADRLEGGDIPWPDRIPGVGAATVSDRSA